MAGQGRKTNYKIPKPDITSQNQEFIPLPPTKPYHRAKYCHQGNKECQHYSVCLGDHTEPEFNWRTRKYHFKHSTDIDFKKYTESGGTCFKDPVTITSDLKAIDASRNESGSRSSHSHIGAFD